MPELGRNRRPCPEGGQRRPNLTRLPRILIGPKSGDADLRGTIASASREFHRRAGVAAPVALRLLYLETVGNPIGGSPPLASRPAPGSERFCFWGSIVETLSLGGLRAGAGSKSRDFLRAGTSLAALNYVAFGRNVDVPLCVPAASRTRRTHAARALLVVLRGARAAGV